ncbi:MAG: hypothetical protein EA368_19110 [Leptolyngbya sp. DLM2.Bin27]|nr:MAG: hypothetical protein EA368_19110 [Leptolyngbya sp. DLM2.Bin27]
MSSPSNRESNQPESPSASLLDRIFRDREGQIVIGQAPNLPLIVGLVATGLQAVLPNGSGQAALDLVAFGAWFTWAWQELFDGVNYFRRSLGLMGLVILIVLRLNV